MAENEIVRQLASAPGRLEFRGIRYMLVRPDTITTFQQAVERRMGPEAAAEAMFLGGYTGGGNSARRLGREMGLGARETAEFMARMGGQLGWGDLRVSTLVMEGDGRLLEIEAADSAFAGAYGPSERPVCHFTRGVFAGVAEVLFGEPVRAEESACAAAGAACCRFRFQPAQPAPPPQARAEQRTAGDG